LRTLFSTIYVNTWVGLAAFSRLAVYLSTFGTTCPKKPQPSFIV